MQLQPHTYNAYHLLHEGILALSHAEQQGIRVDVNYIERSKLRITHKITRIEEKFKDTDFFKHWNHSIKNVNIHSNPQLSTFLYKIKKIEPAKTTETGLGSTDDEALQQLNIPELNILLEIRKLKKIRDTYLDGFLREQVDGFVHPFFNLHLVRTFRSSSDSPNLQNIPIRDEEAKKICRKALFPRIGHQIMEIDFSGIEVRIAACYHNDPTMLKYINDPSTDMHGDMAKQIFMIKKFDKKQPGHYVLRQAAKNGFVFPQFYGDYYKGCAYNMIVVWGKLSSKGRWKVGEGIEIENGLHLSDHLIDHRIRSLVEFEDHLKEIEQDFWNTRFPVYKQWKEDWYRKYLKRGYVDLKTGFRCSGVMTKNDVINYPVQGAAFHCLLWSLIQADKLIQKEKLDSRIIGQIHDSILFDINPTELEFVYNSVKRIMTVELPKAFTWINVPIDAEADLCPVDGSWAEKEKLKL